MLPYRDSQITKIAIGAFFLIVVLYALYEVRGIIVGPRINISPLESEVHDPYVVIEGQAERIDTLKLNGKPITVTEDGAFQEPFLLLVGLNRLFLDAEDKYGRDSHEIIEIVYTPQPTPDTEAPPTDATTTTAATSTDMATSTR